ncbi:hypothetical protein AVEN_74757-1 [Araneus ventricosus]|uniref:Uncharacterized protein n=1 Tax=Araneus ventricosus TaxID=182803 RepID=A0A4Y2JIK9_ARAVE|nr:hypothetical protein AVEN_74757-1 [Araneus ventricosus]
MMAHGRNVDIRHYMELVLLSIFRLVSPLITRYFRNTVQNALLQKGDLGEQSTNFSIWYKNHRPECSENYVGSSNAMEVKAVEVCGRDRWKTVVCDT